MALAYAVSDRGACHMRAYAANEEIFTATAPPYTSEGKGEIVYRMGWWSAVKFSFGICDFWGTITLDLMAEILELVTGEQWTTKELEEIGVRVLNMARAFNQREGFNGMTLRQNGYSGRCSAAAQEQVRKYPKLLLRI